MKKQEDAHKFRHWEKNRRDRFNVLLQELAECLPGYEEENEETQGKETNTKRAKWSKADIVKKATVYIRSLQSLKIPKELYSKIRSIREQNKKLREVLKSELGVELSDSELRKLTKEEICKRVQKNNSQEKTLEKSKTSGSIGDDIFVAPVDHIEDHSYSMKAPNGTDSVEVIAEEEVIARDDEADEADENAGSTANIAETKSKTSKTFSSTDQSKKIIPVSQVAQQSIMVLPQPPILRGVNIVSPSMCGQLFISPNFLIAPKPGVLGNKLPLPPLSSSLVRTTSVCTKPQTSTRIVDLPKKKKKRRKVGDTEANKKAENSNEEKKESSSEEQASACKENGSFTFSDVCTVDSSLPEAILASEDPKEVAKEKEESSKEEKNTSTAITQPENRSCGKNQDEKSSIAVARKRRKDGQDVFVKGKRSKSSYSIAALCQISVNIGADSSSCMVDSPGMASLNSEIGTTSPTSTPVPTTPTPPTATEQPPPIAIQTQPSKQSLSPAPKTSTPSSAVVIQELSPSKSGRDEEKQVTEKSSAPPKLIPDEVLSPSKSYLSNFPVVSKKHEVHESTKKISGPGTSKHSSSPKKNAKVDFQENKQACQPVEEKQRKDLSVFDFTDQRPDEEISCSFGTSFSTRPSSESKGKEKQSSETSNNQSPEKLNPVRFSSKSGQNEVAKGKSAPTAVSLPRQSNVSTVASTSISTTSSVGANQRPCKNVNSSDVSSTQPSQLLHYDSAPVVSSHSLPKQPSSSVTVTSVTSYSRETHMPASQFPPHYYPSLPTATPGPSHVVGYSTTASFPDLTQSSYIQNPHYHQTNYNSPVPPHHSRTQNYPGSHSTSSSGPQLGSEPTEPRVNYERHQGYYRNYPNNAANPGQYYHYGFPPHDPKMFSQKKTNLSPSFKNSGDTLGRTSMFHHQHPMQAIHQPTCHEMITTDKAFSVTQLVSNKQQQPRKSSTKKNSYSSQGANYHSPGGKSKSKNSDTGSLDAKFDHKKPSKSTRGSRKTKPIYSAASLISNPGNMTLSPMEMQNQRAPIDQPHHPYDPMFPPPPPPPPMSDKWPLPDVQSAATSALSFSSISPSPANFFSQDVSALDFSAGLLGHDGGVSSFSFSPIPPTTNTTGSRLSGYNRNSPSSHGFPGKVGDAKHQHDNNNSIPSRGSTSQLIDQQQQQQQYLGPPFFDNNFFPPLPTLTPPNPEDPMLNGQHGQASSQPPPSNNIYSGNLPEGGSSRSQVPYIGQKSTSDRNIATQQMHHSHQHNQQQQQQQQVHPIQHQLQQTMPPSAIPASSSVSNFNLSTIFPDLNDKLTNPLNPRSLQHHPIGSISSTSGSAGNPTLITSSGPIPDVRQLTTPEIPPQGIPIIGHSTHQVSLASVPFPGSTFHNLNFQLPDQ